MMVRLNFCFTERENQALRGIAANAGIVMSDLVRRMVDHCSQGRVLDEMFPHMSGQGIEKLRVQGNGRQG